MLKVCSLIKSISVIGEAGSQFCYHENGIQVVAKITQMFAELQMLSLSYIMTHTHDTGQIKTSILTTKNHSRITNIVLSVVAFQDISIT